MDKLEEFAKRFYNRIIESTGLTGLIIDWKDLPEAHREYWRDQAQKLIKGIYID